MQLCLNARAYVPHASVSRACASAKGVCAMISCVETVRVCFECAGDSAWGRRSQGLIRIARARGEDISYCCL